MPDVNGDDGSRRYLVISGNGKVDTTVYQYLRTARSGVTTFWRGNGTIYEIVNDGDDAPVLVFIEKRVRPSHDE